MHGDVTKVTSGMYVWNAGKIAGGGYGIHWPEIDEDISTEGLLRGAPVPVPLKSKSPWGTGRQTTMHKESHQGFAGWPFRLEGVALPSNRNEVQPPDDDVTVCTCATPHLPTTGKCGLPAQRLLLIPQANIQCYLCPSKARWYFSKCFWKSAFSSGEAKAIARCSVFTASWYFSFT